MDTQRAIEKLLQNFTKELMKVFSESVVRAVGNLDHRPFVDFARHDPAAPCRQ